MKEYFLGVDGGQSSTTALIGDAAGRVIGSGSGGPGNHVAAAEARAKFTKAIDDCVGAACREAGIDAAGVRFTSACLGFSGGPADKQAILKELVKSERMLVTHDGMIALAGATAGEPGLITIAGTGSFAFGRNKGETARAGGWGYLFGDEGSGFYITRQALRAALRFEEGWGPPTSLRPVLLDATGARNVNDLLHRFYTPEFPRARVAGYAKLVDEAAEKGDAAAREVMEEAARELAKLAHAVRQQLFDEEEPARVSYVGGVFRSKMLLERFRTLVQMEPGNQVDAPVYGPAAGALLEAYRAVGMNCGLTNVPEEKV
ncbi:MAG TPA: BadF/BadG/BcrA/BcrD ATPase family protein [Bryobacteraceae bacterium]|nr:BadF/BadG/BcrA/BcrD ATPase family protein [Bryobacteraceae bacterium]